MYLYNPFGTVVVRLYNPFGTVVVRQRGVSYCAMRAAVFLSPLKSYTFNSFLQQGFLSFCSDPGSH